VGRAISELALEATVAIVVLSGRQILVMLIMGIQAVNFSSWVRSLMVTVAVVLIEIAHACHVACFADLWRGL